MSGIFNADGFLMAKVREDGTAELVQSHEHPEPSAFESIRSSVNRDVMCWDDYASSCWISLIITEKNNEMYRRYRYARYKEYGLGRSDREAIRKYRRQWQAVINHLEGVDKPALTQRYRDESGINALESIEQKILDMLSDNRIHTASNRRFQWIMSIVFGPGAYEGFHERSLRFGSPYLPSFINYEWGRDDYARCQKYHKQWLEAKTFLKEALGS